MDRSIDREKVIEELVNIREDIEAAICYEEGCCRLEYLQTVIDAIALLKEQEPSVMTLDDIVASYGPLYLEVKDDFAEIARNDRYDDSRLYFSIVGSEDIEALDISDYLKDWRCWTFNPGYARRKETPWE